jgi:hypothetical protein
MLIGRPPRLTWLPLVSALVGVSFLAPGVAVAVTAGPRHGWVLGLVGLVALAMSTLRTSGTPPGAAGCRR